MEHAMDRQKAVPTRRKTWPVITGAVALGSAVILLASLKPSASSIERSAVVIDEARRGEFAHEIAAPGALVAEQTRLISAPAAGRVDALHVESGDAVGARQEILTLTNREVIEDLLEIEQQLAVAEADLTDLAATLQARSLESEKTLGRTDFEKRDAERQSEAASQLAGEGLISNLEAVRAREAAAELSRGVATETQRHRALEKSAAAQLQAQRNRIERLRALHSFRKSVVDSLVVRTPAAGTIRELMVQEGETVSDGQRLARLVAPGRLKAVLQVPEATALEVKPGQPVTLNARGTALTGTVERIGAAVEQGTVAVEVRLSGELPAELRPDLSVDARIEIRRLPDVVSIARPVNAEANSSNAIYRLDPDGRARKVEVHYGPASTDRIIISKGATAGDRFIVGGAEGRNDPVLRLE